jgi:hypothetical protein
MATGGDDETVQKLIEGLSASERGAVLALWFDELVRGWVPKQADLDAALHLIRGGGRP